MLDAIIDFVFPSRCIGCDRKPKQLCDECLLAPNTRSIGGFPFPVFAALALENVAEKVIAGYKDQQLTALERPLAKVVAQLFSTQDLSRADAVLTPARNPKNYRKRGFDPAQRLAQKALRIAGLRIPVLAMSSSHIRLDQRGLSKSQRSQNVFESMELLRPGLGRVVLFDDVITTGATVHEMARACDQAGVAVALCCVLAQRNFNN